MVIRLEDNTIKMPAPRLAKTASWLALAALVLTATGTPGVARAEGDEVPRSLSSSSSEATGSTGAPVIKLKDLIDEALSNRPLLKAAKFEAQSKEAEIAPKGSYERPVVGVAAMNYPVDTFSAGEFGMTGKEVSLTQKIPFPGKLSKLSNAAESEYFSKKETYNNKQLELIKEVRLAYYALYLAYKRRDTLNEQLGLIRNLIGVTRSRYSLNKVTQAEVLSLQTEEGNLMDQILMAEKQIAVKTGDLNHAVGRASHHTIARPEDLKKTKIDLTKLTEQAFGERILAKNPSLKAMGYELDAADNKLSYSKWNYLPDFEFRVGYTFREPSPGDRGVNFVSGAVGVSIPLWALSKESEEVKGARADKAKAEALLDEERIHMLHMVHTNYSELEEAYNRLKLLEGGLLPLARQAVISGKSAYLTGKMDYATILNITRSRFQTELSYYEALANYESKIAEFESLVGEPLEAK